MTEPSASENGDFIGSRAQEARRLSLNILFAALTEVLLEMERPVRNLFLQDFEEKIAEHLQSVDEVPSDAEMLLGMMLGALRAEVSRGTPDED